MPKVRIWTPESDNDCKAVEIIANKIVQFKESNWTVSTSTKQAYITAVKKNELDKMVKNYLKKDDLVLFLIDHDGIQSINERQQQNNSLLNQISNVVQSNENVKLIIIQQELESWLLVDCLGIICFFTKNEHDHQNDKWLKLAKKFQKGDTSVIIEAESGGNGAKEYLYSFSDEINKQINPNLKDKPKNLKEKRYDECQAPEVAKYLSIDEITIQRNPSLQEFSEYFEKVIADL